MDWKFLGRWFYKKYPLKMKINQLATLGVSDKIWSDLSFEAKGAIVKEIEEQDIKVLSCIFWFTVFTVIIFNCIALSKYLMGIV